MFQQRGEKLGAGNRLYVKIKGISAVEGMASVFNGHVGKGHQYNSLYIDWESCKDRFYDLVREEEERGQLLYPRYTSGYCKIKYDSLMECLVVESFDPDLTLYVWWKK